MNEPMKLFDYVKQINTKSGGRIELPEKNEYNSFVINKVFSNTPDSVLFANEANKHSITNEQMNYDFYYYGLTRKLNRFGKWYKSEKVLSDIEFIMSTYGYSKEKAESVYDLLLPNIESLKQMFETGGKQSTKQTKNQTKKG